VLFGAGSEVGDAVDRLMEPVLRQSLDPAEIARLTGEIARALHDVYLTGIAIAAATLLLGIWLPAGHGATAAKPAD
jgi:hypothetical protein